MFAEKRYDKISSYFSRNKHTHRLKSLLNASKGIMRKLAQFVRYVEIKLNNYMISFHMFILFMNI